jgi:predicted ATP-grasp superfamily ATP-dependent carboligase
MTPLIGERTSARPRSLHTGAPGGALLLGCDYRALGIARSLGRKGIAVVALRAPGEPLAAASRFVRHSIPWPEDPAAHLDFLCELGESLSGWVLIPTADESAALAARNHEQLGEFFTVAVPPWDVLKWAYDKRLTYRLAERVGVAQPHTILPRDAEALARMDVTFPAVLKPAVKESFNRLTAAKAWRVDDRDQLLERYEEAAGLVDPTVLMIQELVPGAGDDQFSFAALCRDGAPLVWLTARRTRQYPADFGRASTFVETVACREIEEPSHRLLSELGFTGLVELEYKRDARDGAFKLLDINPRVWGWQSLCGRAGVDFPFLQWRMLSGRHVPAARAVEGVRWLRLATDTPTALREVLHRRLPLRRYLSSLRPGRERAIMAWDDPLPGLAELPVLGYVLARRLLRGGGV